MSAGCGKDSKQGQVVLEYDFLALVAKLQSGRSGRSLVDRIQDDQKSSLEVSFLASLPCEKGGKYCGSLFS